MSPRAQPAQDQEICSKQTGDRDTAAHAADPAVPTVTSGPDATSTVDSPQLASGCVLEGRFVVIRLLGSGGMGEVYEAEDLKLQRERFALKVIRPDFAFKRGLQERFQREVVLGRSIAHPNVCPVREFFTSLGPRGEIWFFTMKLLTGETLATRLRRTGPLPIDQAVRFATQIAAGLDAAHQARIVHRDLKPGNIFLEEHASGLRAVVTDFGLAHELSQTVGAKATEHVVGTPSYIAPEVMRGEPATIRSDLYSFGVVIHEMLFGGRPGSSSREKVSSQRLRRFRSVVERCLQPNPELRYATAGEVAAALASADGPWVTRRRLITGAAAAMIAGGVTWSERDDIYRWTHPVPRPRRVAVLADSSAAPEQTAILGGVLEAISGVLARAEAAERDLLVIPPRMLRAENVDNDSKAAGMFGANLVLSGSLRALQNNFKLTLQLLESATGKLVRRASVLCLPETLYNLPQEAARLATGLLDVHARDATLQSASAGTTNSDAYAAWQRGRDLLHKFDLPSVDRSIAELQKAVDLDPRFALAYADLARAYASRFRLTRSPASLDVAERNSEKALSLAPKLGIARASKALIESNKGDYEAAAEDLREALRLEPENVDTLNSFADLYQQEGQFKLADNAYEQILKQRPNYWPALNDWGRAHFARSDYREAEKLLSEATEIAPNAALPWRNLSAVYIETERYEDAKSAAERSIALLPTGEALSNLGTALFWKRRYAEAATNYQKAVQLSPKRDDIWCNLGDAYEALGAKTEAIPAWKKASELAAKRLQTNPKSKDAQADEALYFAKLGDRSKAKELLTHLDSDSEQDVYRLFDEAVAYELTGERNTALRLIAKCSQMGYSRFEILHVPELAALRKDPRFRA